MYPVDFLYKAALRTPDAIAVADDRQEVSYRALVRRANALAAGYQKLARKERVKIAVLAPNSVDLFVAIMAIHAAGAILVPLNPRVARRKSTSRSPPRIQI
jgi:fatty-acyl-CoA synthase